MDTSQWFRDQFTASGDGFVWAMEQVPPEHLFISRPRFPEEWPAARYAFHMLHYEKCIALPFMRYWLGEPLPTNMEETYRAEQDSWEKGHSLESLLSQFRAVRAEQIILLEHISDAMWDEKRETIWGCVTMRWAVTKTYQHTAEHTHDVLCRVLFWDVMNKQLPEKGEYKAWNHLLH